MAFDDLYIIADSRARARRDRSPVTPRKRSMSPPPSLLLDSFPEDLSFSDRHSSPRSRALRMYDVAARQSDFAGVSLDKAESSAWSSLFPILEAAPMEEDGEFHNSQRASLSASAAPFSSANAWARVEEVRSRESSPLRSGAKRHELGGMQKLALDRFPSYHMEEVTKRQRSLPTIPESAAVWPLGSPAHKRTFSSS